MIILEIIGVIVFIALVFGLLSTILGKSLVYKKYGDKPFVTPDFLPSILIVVFNFLIDLPSRIFNSKEYKLKKMLSKRSKLLMEIDKYEYQILSFEKIFENENNQWAKIRQLKEDLKSNTQLSIYEKNTIQNEINLKEMQHLNLTSGFSNYSNRQEYNNIKDFLESSKKELIKINESLKIITDSK